VDESIQYSKGRYAGGKPIGDHPVIRQYIAGMQMAVEASRLATWRAAWKASQGGDFLYEAALAKAYATSTAEEVSLKAVQIMGGAGISLEYPVAKLVDDAKILYIIEGTTEIQKYTISEILYSKGRYAYFSS
jgi:alkylation response protein AidB-like acyl-CoA dehydrogenase